MRACNERALLGEGGGGGGRDRGGEGGDWGWCVGGNGNRLPGRLKAESYAAPASCGAAEEGAGHGDFAPSGALPGDEMGMVTKAIHFA